MNYPDAVARYASSIFMERYTLSYEPSGLCTSTSFSLFGQSYYPILLFGLSVLCMRSLPRFVQLVDQSFSYNRRNRHTFCKPLYYPQQPEYARFTSDSPIDSFKFYCHNGEDFLQWACPCFTLGTVLFGHGLEDLTSTTIFMKHCVKTSYG